MAAKGEIPADGIPALTRLTHLHFSYKTAFRGTIRGEFDTHVTSLSSVHPCNIDSTAHVVTTKEYEGSRIVCSRGIAFIPAYVAHAILETSPDGISASIAEVACRAYRLLT